MKEQRTENKFKIQNSKFKIQKDIENYGIIELWKHL